MCGDRKFIIALARLLWDFNQVINRSFNVHQFMGWLKLCKRWHSSLIQRLWMTFYKAAERKTKKLKISEPFWKFLLQYLNYWPHQKWRRFQYRTKLQILNPPQEASTKQAYHKLINYYYVKSNDKKLFPRKNIWKTNPSLSSSESASIINSCCCLSAFYPEIK